MDVKSYKNCVNCIHFIQDENLNYRYIFTLAYTVYDYNSFKEYIESNKDIKCKEYKFNAEDFEELFHDERNYSSDDIICPICGCKNTPDDIDKDSCDWTCCMCDEEFEVIVNYSPEYTTYIKRDKL